MKIKLSINQKTKDPFLSVRYEHAGETDDDVMRLFKALLKDNDLEMTNVGGSQIYTSFYLTLKPKVTSNE
ncbi:hypothetical protein [Spirosoma arcticum]